MSPVAVWLRFMKQPKTVLVVDDYPTLCDLISCQLMLLGYKVLTAFDGRKAQEIVLKPTQNIDLLIADLKMPKMGGHELADWFQAANPKAKVLLMSTHTDGIKDSSNLLSLRKPFQMATLRERLQELFQNNESVTPLSKEEHL